MKNTQSKQHRQSTKVGNANKASEAGKATGISRTASKASTAGKAGKASEANESNEASGTTPPALVTTWHNLAQPGTTWHNLAQPGTTWRRVFGGGGQAGGRARAPDVFSHNALFFWHLAHGTVHLPQPSTNWHQLTHSVMFCFELVS